MTLEREREKGEEAEGEEEEEGDAIELEVPKARHVAEGPWDGLVHEVTKHREELEAREPDELCRGPAGQVVVRQVEEAKHRDVRERPENLPGEEIFREVEVGESASGVDAGGEGGIEVVIGEIKGGECGEVTEGEKEGIGEEGTGEVREVT